MKLFHFHRKEDFGTEWCFSLFRFKKYSLVQFSFNYNDYPTRPCVILYIGLNSLLDITIDCWKLGFCVDLISPNWTYASLRTDFDFPV